MNKKTDEIPRFLLLSLYTFGITECLSIFRRMKVKFVRISRKSFPTFANSGYMTPAPSKGYILLDYNI